jgi:hypothetical protein
MRRERGLPGSEERGGADGAVRGSPSVVAASPEKGRFMSSLRTYAILWFSGLIAGVVIMERWRRTGKRLIPSAPSTGNVGATPATGSPSTHSKPKVTTVLVTGARTDVERVQQFVKRVTPWTSPAPSVAVPRGFPTAAPNDAADQPR